MSFIHTLLFTTLQRRKFSSRVGRKGGSQINSQMKATYALNVVKFGYAPRNVPLLAVSYVTTISIEHHDFFDLLISPPHSLL